MGIINGFEITQADQIIPLLTEYRNTYHDRGKYLGWEKMDAFYSMNLGNCTDWTGFPMSGKTQVLMECLMNTSLWYEWKHLVYFPDVGNNVEIIADLIHKKIGKTFDPNKPNSITDEEIKRAATWVTHYFKVLTKKEVKAKMTPMEFWDMAVELKKSEGLHTASIDSWKDMSHPYNENGGYAQYLEMVLPYRNQMAEDNNLHFHTIIHPKLPEKVNGKRNPPTPYDLKGGSEWFNSGKCMVTVHREDLSFNKATITFTKIKPRSIGSIGSLELFFDVNKFVYYDLIQNGGNMDRLYAAKKGEEVKEVEVIVKANMNGFLHSDFDSTVEDLYKKNDDNQLLF
jgi:hypothetical protein